MCIRLGLLRVRETLVRKTVGSLQLAAAFQASMPVKNAFSCSLNRDSTALAFVLGPPDATKHVSVQCRRSRIDRTMPADDTGHP